MTAVFNCIKAIINALLGQNDTASKSSNDTFEESQMSVTKADTLNTEQSKDVMSADNIIITEMLASLSILEEAEASIIEKHRVHQNHRNKLIEVLSEIVELETATEQETLEKEENALKKPKPLPEEPKPHPEGPKPLPEEPNPLAEGPKPLPEGPKRTPEEPEPVVLTQQEQRRVNIVNEIINTERDYVKNLRDIHEGYYKQCLKSKDLFPHARLKTIFSNIGNIYKMHKKLLASLEKNYNLKEAHLSRIGSCFIDQEKAFMMYSEYCKSHEKALDEWSKLIMVEKYAYFFEVCRQHQQMIDLTLDGFLIMPVQKICKYPLLLMELLRVTPIYHKDHDNVEAALVIMRNVLSAINTLKGEDEVEDKVLKFQQSILNWQGENLSIRSTQLIHRGDLIIIQQPRARAKSFVGFLFDHQMILCKKDMLRRNMLYYKESINIDEVTVMDVEDGKDLEFDCKVKNAIKLTSTYGNVLTKLLYTKCLPDKQLWLRAFEEERVLSEGEKDEEDTTYYDFPALNVSTVTVEQLSFLAQPIRRKSSFLRSFRSKMPFLNK